MQVIQGRGKDMQDWGMPLGPKGGGFMGYGELEGLQKVEGVPLGEEGCPAR